MATLDYSHAHNQHSLPHRRPLPTGAQVTMHNDSFSHSRSRNRTSDSSNILPTYYTQATPAISLPPGVPPQSNRRTLSNATTSTTSTTSNPSAPPQPRLSTMSAAPSSSYASSIRRSTSSRSNASQNACSYVALMRKQKATVWCDRAQHEDPRLLQQQRMAKARAQAEVVGGVSAVGALRVSGPSKTSSSGVVGGVRSKIRHHGAVKASAYNGGLGSGVGNLSGQAVPMRLSASEVDEAQSDEDALERAQGRLQHHQRQGSGRSSLGSGQRTQSAYYPGGPNRYSGVGTPGSGNSYSPSEQGAPPPFRERENSTATTVHSSLHSSTDETPMPPPPGERRRSDYFGHSHPSSSGLTTGSGSSGEERGFGGVSELPEREERGGGNGGAKEHSTDDLRRRGSVDDRTMTMSGVRLFIANPDNDSD